MRAKKCKHCGTLFETDKQGAYLCPECALASRQASHYRERVCIDCGKPFMGYPASRRCEVCAAERKRQVDREYKKRGPARPIGSTDICQKCGKPYIVSGGAQKYCKDCAEEAVRDKVRAAKQKYMAEYMTDDRIAAKEANRTNNKVCLICGAVFDDGQPSVTCSPECNRELKKRQHDKSASRPEFIQRQKARQKQRWASMTPEQREANNAKMRENYHKRKARKKAEEEANNG